MKNRDIGVGYMMIAPAVIMLGIFVIIPLFMAFQYSFYDVSFFIESRWVGLDNFRIILGTRMFRQSIFNAIRFVVILVPLSLTLSFLIANALAGVPKPYASAVKTAIFIPGVVSGIAIGLIFNFIFNFNAGIVNQTMMNLGFDRIAIFTTVRGAVGAIVFVSLWMGIGGSVILMYAARTGIPTSYYEAASIDGANALQKLIYVTIPQMKNVFILVTIGGVTGTLQMFDLPFIMTGGGPAGNTVTPMLFMFNTFRDPERTLGYTVSGALLLMVIIAILNSFVFAVVRSERSLEG